MTHPFIRTMLGGPYPPSKAYDFLNVFHYQACVASHGTGLGSNKKALCLYCTSGRFVPGWVLCIHDSLWGDTIGDFVPCILSLWFSVNFSENTKKKA